MGADESGILVAEYTSLRYCVGVQSTYERVESWSARWRMLLSYSAFRRVGPGRCCRRSLSALTMLVGIVLPLAAHAGGDDWADFATVSMTNPTTPKLTANRLCYTDGRDIACDGAAGLLVTSGTLAIPNISATALTVNGVPITGNASGDRITSGTAGLFANMIGGYISLTTGATTWGYLGSSATYLPTLGVGGNISSTSISTTVAQIASRTVASIAGSGGNYIVSGTTSVSTSSAGSITFVTASSQRMVIDSSGRVGIGTATPSRALQVVGGGVEIIADTNAGTSWAVFGAGYNGARKAYLAYYPNNGANGFAQLSTEAAEPLHFAINNMEKMRLDTNGNLGIGTTNPVAILDIISSTVAPQLRIGNGLGGASGVSFAFYAANSGMYGAMEAYGSSGKLPLALNPWGGNVGIGTTNPGYKLEVAGQVAGNAAYVNTSDVRLKTNIHAIPYGLTTVQKLRPVTFEWKAQKENWQKGRKLGLIAQEVEQIVPEAVTTASDTSGTKSIAYSDLTPILIKAVQELKADNDNLRLLVERQAEQLKSEQADKADILRRLEALERHIH